MNRRVAVIGAGASGTAAAYAAHDQGASVTVIMGRPGATSFASGALDGAGGRRLGDEGADVRPFLRALGIWELREEGCRVATAAGLLREAAGHDRAVLDFSRVSPGIVAVVDAERAGWNAASLARAWTREPWASSRGLRFEPVAVQAIRYRTEPVLPDAEFASLHDDPDRVSWLLDRLQQAFDLKDKSAVVTGPWLGLKRDVAGSLSSGLGKPVGEPLSTPGGIAGLRFELARDELFAKRGVERTGGWAVAARVDEEGLRPRVELESGAAIDVDAVILTVGGLIGGGLSWSPSASFTVSVASPAALAWRGERLRPSGSPHGALFESFAWSGERSPVGIERVGIWTDADGRVRDDDGGTIPWLYAAGDTMADAPRTLVAAIRSGLLAGSRAARGPAR